MQLLEIGLERKRRSKYDAYLRRFSLCSGTGIKARQKRLNSSSPASRHEDITSAVWQISSQYFHNFWQALLLLFFADVDCLKIALRLSRSLSDVHEERSYQELPRLCRNTGNSNQIIKLAKALFRSYWSCNWTSINAGCASMVFVDCRDKASSTWMHLI